LSNLSNRERLLVILGAILIILYPYYNFFLKPIRLEINTVNQSISDKKLEYNLIEKLKVTNVRNSKKLEEIKAKYNQAVKALPENERNPEISYSLNSISTKNNIKLISVTFGEIAGYFAKSSVNDSKATTKKSNTNATSSSISSTDQKLMVVPVTVIINGDYASTLNFINSIEGDIRLAEVVNVSMSSQGETKVLQATIILNYYSTQGTTKYKPSYDFKDDKAGKTDLFN